MQNKCKATTMHLSRVNKPVIYSALSKDIIKTEHMNGSNTTTKLQKIKHNSINMENTPSPLKHLILSFSKKTCSVAKLNYINLEHNN
jgi:hypothetical protein